MGCDVKQSAKIWHLRSLKRVNSLPPVQSALTSEGVQARFEIEPILQVTIPKLFQLRIPCYTRDGERAVVTFLYELRSRRGEC